MTAARDIMKLDLANLRFLVVEDNTHMRRIIRMLLTGFGARDVVEAEDGASGLEAFQATSPDIVIADWVMPIIDGLELSRMLRNRDSSTNSFVPIIMLTGHSEKKRVIEARDAGITEFLCKPISAKSLYLRIASTIVNPRAFIQTKSYFGPDRRRNESSNYQGEERRTHEPAEFVATPMAS